MRLGFVLATAPLRPNIMDQSLRSLANTVVGVMNRPVLQIVHKAPWDPYIPYVLELKKNWEVHLNEDLPFTTDINTRFSIFGDRIIKLTDITHIGFLVDDFLYHSDWLYQLMDLIDRHSEARAWSVYRSRYSKYHQVIRTDINGDCLMTMHDCVGTISRQEWEEYGAVNRTDFTSVGNGVIEGGTTIDIHHALCRPGERWATGRDYMENLGRHKDIEHLDCAIDFVGVA